MIWHFQHLLQSLLSDSNKPYKTWALTAEYWEFSECEQKWESWLLLEPEKILKEKDVLPIYLTDTYFAPWSNITQLPFRSALFTRGKRRQYRTLLEAWKVFLHQHVLGGIGVCMCVPMCHDWLRVRINNLGCAFTSCLYRKSVLG